MTAFDTTTAAGRLRILWNATADPQLAMGADEVADVETVLQEHAAMTTELETARNEIERQRAEREALVAGYDKRGHEIAELRRDRNARQVELRAELEQRQAVPIVAVGDEQPEEGCFCGCWRGDCQCVWGDWGCPCGRDCPICHTDEGA